MAGIEDVLVIVTLRGGLDGINAVVPYADPSYRRWRRELGLSAPGKSRESCLDLDGFFGLHPALAPLMAAWERRDLTILHAAGWPEARHSHFEAWEEIESGVAGPARPTSGWLARALTSLPATGPLAAVSVSETVPLLLRGYPGAVVMPSLDGFRLMAPAAEAKGVHRSLDELYSEASGESGAAGRATLSALSKLDSIRSRMTAGTGGYEATRFGQGLRLVGELIRQEAGMRVAVVDLPGWDTHFAQGAAHGPLADRLREFAEGLAMFWPDVSKASARTTVLAFSEFGRRVEENGSGGTDHGHGGVVFELGSKNGGGAVAGRWPGLAEGQLTGPGDLAVTTDLRSIFSRIARGMLGSRAEGLFREPRANFAGGGT